MKNLFKEIYALGAFGFLAATKYLPSGTNIFEHEWDLLIILDACRVDALEAVADEYSFIENIEETWSVGSTSKEWIANTFRKKYAYEISNTTYITSNAFAADVLETDPDWMEWGSTSGTWISTQRVLEPLIERNVVTSEDLGGYHPIWNLSDKHDHGHTPYPEDVTEYAIKVGRLEKPSRTILHYMQPHAPYLGNVDHDSEIDDLRRFPLKQARDGADRGKLWNEYLDNLRYVLDDVERLLQNFDANKVVITADHGELFGEFDQYDHGVGIPHPSLRKVPWVETSAQDHSTIDPKVEIDDHTETEDVKERLRNLGYFD